MGRGKGFDRCWPKLFYLKKLVSEIFLIKNVGLTWRGGGIKNYGQTISVSILFH